VRITVAEGRYQDALLARDVDLAIVGIFPGMMDDPLLSSMLLFDDPLEYALLPASHPMASQDILSAADLREETFLFVSHVFAPLAHDLILREVRRLGLGTHIRPAYTSARTIWAAVASEEGWGIGPRSLHNAAPAGTVARRVEGLSIPWSVSLHWRREDTDPVVRQVADIVIAQAAETS
jgi:DNA-binding transcriptional LysR family regulator